MAQVVYYCCWNGSLGYDLEPLSNYFYNNVYKNDEQSELQQCPAFKEYLKNVFIVKSVYQYDFEWVGNNIISKSYDQSFFDENMVVRNSNTGILSFRTPQIYFVAESEDLILSQEFPYLHDNDITRNCYVIPGSFNIGKHLPRSLELSLKFKRPSEVTIQEGDALYYTRFLTKEKIIFKKFIMTPALFNLAASHLNIKNFNKGIKPLQWWYDLVTRHNLKKYILREIKNNLL